MVPRRHNTRPSRTAPGHCRYKTRPAAPFSPHARYKTRPARSKWPNLACFARAWRTFYRFRQEEATQGELYTEYKSEKGLAITAHHAPRAWRAPEAWLRHPRAAAGGRHSPPTGTRTTPEHDLIRPTRTTPRRIGIKLSPHTRPRRMSGIKLSPLTPSRRMSGIKLSPHTRPRRMSGIKLSPLTRNGPIWRVLPAQGEFCTALVSKTPSRENFVSVSPPRIHAGRTLYRTQGTNRANHNSTPRTTGVERTSGTTGPRRGIRGRRRHHRQANFACNSPTAQTNASSKTAEYQRSHFNT